MKGLIIIDNFKDEQEKLQLQMLKYNMAEETLLHSVESLMKEFELNNEYIPIEHIKSRIKKEDSAISKLEEKGYNVTVDNLVKYIRDMVGVRIVCSFLSDVYDIVKVLEKTKQFKIVEKQDYIKTPKETGYSSYHLMVKVPIYLNEGKDYIDAEIQIRTVAMDFWASLDHKLQYKFKGDIPAAVAEEMFKCSQDVKKLDHRMLDLNMTVNNYKEKEKNK